MPDRKVQVPDRLRPTLQEAQSAYQGWLDARDADYFFSDDAAQESAGRFAAAVDELVAGSLSSEVEPFPLRQALLSAFPEAVEYGLLDFAAYPAFDSLPQAQAGDVSTESESRRESLWGRLTRAQDSGGTLEPSAGKPAVTGNPSPAYR